MLTNLNPCTILAQSLHVRWTMSQPKSYNSIKPSTKHTHKNKTIKATKQKRENKSNEAYTKKYQNRVIWNQKKKHCEFLFCFTEWKFSIVQKKVHRLIDNVSKHGQNAYQFGKLEMSLNSRINFHSFQSQIRHVHVDSYLSSILVVQTKMQNC